MIICPSGNGRHERHSDKPLRSCPRPSDFQSPTSGLIDCAEEIVSGGQFASVDHETVPCARESSVPPASATHLREFLPSPGRYFHALRVDPGRLLEGRRG